MPPEEWLVKLIRISMVSHKDSIAQLGTNGLVPVFNHTDIAVAKQVLDACYAGGVRVFEFTNRGDNALEVFKILAQYAQKYEDLLLGIGTIFSKEDAEKFHNAGAKFIVSPAMVPEMAEYCKSHNVLWIPGCGTVTEIHKAVQHGASIVKAFPGNVLGPGFVKAVKAVFPKLPIMPTGGVAPTEENLKAWFDAGVTCVGMGSKLIKKEMLVKEGHVHLENVVRETLSLIAKVRS